MCVCVCVFVSVVACLAVRRISLMLRGPLLFTTCRTLFSCVVVCLDHQRSLIKAWFIIPDCLQLAYYSSVHVCVCVL